MGSRWKSFFDMVMSARARARTCFFLYCRSFICLCTQNSLKVKGQYQLNAFKMESLIRIHCSLAGNIGSLFHECKIMSECN